MRRNTGDLAAGTGYTLVRSETTSAVIYHAVEEKIVTSTTGSYTPTWTSSSGSMAFDNHSYGGITLGLLCSGSDNPPTPGQWVYDELVTMTGTTGGPLKFAFADGSLSIKIDNKDRSAMIASYDGAAKTFELTAELDPAFGQQVFATYQGR